MFKEIYRVELSNPKYPRILRETVRPPEKLYYRGDAGLIELLNAGKILSIGIVGSRKISAYGQAAVQKIITGLTGLPVVIISGLALGIDAAAHQAALNAELPTIAVLGSGLNDQGIYPPQNQNLAALILKTNGLLISEFEIDEPAYKSNFPQRNRVIAGLCAITIIAEAAEKSGALITAGFAIEQNREVGAIPGSIFSQTSVGCNALIKEGAIPITCAEDIIARYPILTPKKIRQGLLNLDLNLNPEEEKIYQVIGSASLTGDEICKISGLKINTVSICLASLEIKNLIKNSGQNIYIKI